MLNIDKNTEIHLSLWKYFTDDAAKIKDRMWTMASWMFTLQAGIIAFIGKNIVTTEGYTPKVQNHVLMLICAALGFVLSMFTLFMIQQYGSHIRGMWNRADKVRRHISGLTEIWLLDDAVEIQKDAERVGHEDKSLPKAARRLMYMGSGFGLVFFGIFIFLLIEKSIIKNQKPSHGNTHRNSHQNLHPSSPYLRHPWLFL
jgi:hypothetical protein